MIGIRNCSKFYKKHKGIEDITFIAQEPGLYILVGQNGSGKSSVIKILAKIIYKTKGEVINDKLISYLPDNFSFPKLMRVKSYIQKILYFYNSNKSVSNLMNLYMLPNKKISELSKGNIQKLGILQIIENDTDYYLFDEPLDGLDDYAKKLFKSLITELIYNNKIVIMALHNKNIFKDLKPKVIKLKEGKINASKAKV